MSDYAITKDKLMALLPGKLGLAAQSMMQRQDRTEGYAPPAAQYTQPQVAPKQYVDPMVQQLQLSPQEAAQSLAAMRQKQMERMRQIQQAQELARQRQVRY